MKGSKSVAKKAMKSPHVARSFSMPVAPHHDKYEIEDAARTMESHAKVKANKHLHRAAKKHLRKKHHQIGKILKEK